MESHKFSGLVLELTLVYQETSFDSMDSLGLVVGIFHLSHRVCLHVDFVLVLCHYLLTLSFLPANTIS